MRIKCPHCNGKGFSEINSALNLTCGWCMGQGELDLEIVPTEPQTEAEIEKKWENTVWDTDVYLDDLDGKEQQTEQEYLQTCNTEQLAEFLYETGFMGMWQVDMMRSAEKEKITVEEAIQRWLQQPHTDKE